MNTNSVNDILIEMLQSVQAVGGSIIGFGQEQIPQVITELLWWKGFSAFILWVIFGLIVPFICYKLTKTFFKAGEITDVDTFFNANPQYGVPSIFLIIGSVASVLISWTTNIPVFLQILIAPRLYLIEYASTLIK